MLAEKLERHTVTGYWVIWRYGAFACWTWQTTMNRSINHHYPDHFVFRCDTSDVTEEYHCPLYRHWPTLLEEDDGQREDIKSRFHAGQ